MAKNFPFFKFIASEWLTGDIVFEDFATQGLFINICALYWQRDGNISFDDLVKRYRDKDLLNNLIGKYMYVENGNILIKFLNEQLVEANHISKINSENGKKGAMAKQKQATAKRWLSENERPPSKEEKEKEKEKDTSATDEKFIKVAEMFKRVRQWQEDELKIEVGKFLNKYPDIEPNKAGALINTWAVNYEPEKAKPGTFDASGKYIPPHGDKFPY